MSPIRDLTQAERAARAGISRATQNKLDHVTINRPDLAARVAAGELSVDAAYREAKRKYRDIVQEALALRRRVFALEQMMSHTESRQFVAAVEELMRKQRPR